MTSLGTGEVMFNTAGSAPCAGSDIKVAGSTSAVTNVTVGVALAASESNKMTRGANSILDFDLIPTQSPPRFACDVTNALCLCDL